MSHVSSDIERRRCLRLLGLRKREHFASGILGGASFDNVLPKGTS